MLFVFVVLGNDIFGHLQTHSVSLGLDPLCGAEGTDGDVTATELPAQTGPKHHIHWRNDPPLPFAIRGTAIRHAAFARGVIPRLLQKFLGLRSGTRVIDGNHILPCQPVFISLRLEFLYEYIHGNLHHVFTTRALKKKQCQWPLWHVTGLTQVPGQLIPLPRPLACRTRSIAQWRSWWTRHSWSRGWNRRDRRTGMLSWTRQPPVWSGIEQKSFVIMLALGLSDVCPWTRSTRIFRQGKSRSIPITGNSHNHASAVWIRLLREVRPQQKHLTLSNGMPYFFRIEGEIRVILCLKKASQIWELPGKNPRRREGKYGGVVWVSSNTANKETTVYLEPGAQTAFRVLEVCSTCRYMQMLATI